ncbi:MAG: Aspartyl/glutamyl-tRNA(Asn/Gln) amidotransferase subunit C [Candidatus Magnetoglobus multicellularis str. Araruama]|uniref:Aspartyl/glutamyl-tRNA(Asn/Gln) amidotransferase subunit C n=1 Tax=Candidatus Magnetoglobus multicellularis str. Araruama TaxID=890399 RepID=A0A1V1PG65_9BACT|nr:MAG: Aspartyl/glutamyl-tRNA(Asn/Gln) amidotransferase subunit C [Candidatus Magnetoglobus multicellularis str. Araruama]
MAITKKDILHIAELARLNLATDEIETFTNQFGDILSYMERLNQVNTDEVPPLSHPGQMINAFREDLVMQSIPTQLALSNAPNCDESAFIVPKVVG